MDRNNSLEDFIAMLEESNFNGSPILSSPLSTRPCSQLSQDDPELAESLGKEFTVNQHQSMADGAYQGSPFDLDASTPAPPTTTNSFVGRRLTSIHQPGPRQRLALATSHASTSTNSPCPRVSRSLKPVSRWLPRNSLNPGTSPLQCSPIAIPIARVNLSPPARNNGSAVDFGEEFNLPHLPASNPIVEADCSSEIYNKDCNVADCNSNINANSNSAQVVSTVIQEESFVGTSCHLSPRQSTPNSASLCPSSPASSPSTRFASTTNLLSPPSTFTPTKTSSNNCLSPRKKNAPSSSSLCTQMDLSPNRGLLLPSVKHPSYSPSPRSSSLRSSYDALALSPLLACSPMKSCIAVHAIARSRKNEPCRKTTSSSSMINLATPPWSPQIVSSSRQPLDQDLIDLNTPPVNTSQCPANPSHGLANPSQGPANPSQGPANPSQGPVNPSNGLANINTNPSSLHVVCNPVVTGVPHIHEQTNPSATPPPHALKRTPTINPRPRHLFAERHDSPFASSAFADDENSPPTCWSTPAAAAAAVAVSSSVSSPGQDGSNSVGSTQFSADAEWEDLACQRLATQSESPVASTSRVEKDRASIYAEEGVNDQVITTPDAGEVSNATNVSVKVGDSEASDAVEVNAEVSALVDNISSTTDVKLTMNTGVDDDSQSTEATPNDDLLSTVVTPTGDSLSTADTPTDDSSKPSISSDASVTLVSGMPASEQEDGIGGEKLAMLVFRHYIIVVYFLK